MKPIQSVWEWIDSQEWYEDEKEQARELVRARNRKNLNPPRRAEWERFDARIREARLLRADRSPLVKLWKKQAGA